MKNVVILGGARDFHAMDWYRTVKKNILDMDVVFLTDSIDGEGFQNIIEPSDKIEKLMIIDKYLFKKQSSLGNIWRNILKLLVLPAQIYLLKRFNRKNPESVYHAHPMYYMFLCWLSGIEYIGSPQGDEILIRPKKSKLYNYFAKKALKAAKYVIVDSYNMKKEIKELCNVEALVHQYGIDIDELNKYKNLKKKTKITSIRGMLPLYRIEEVFISREACKINEGISFIYPYYEESYLKRIQKQMLVNDYDRGRLNKKEMYKLLSESYLVLSIPESDSSPRSVYESIFLGCCIAVTYNLYIESLPNCMRERIIIVDLTRKNWFKEAIEEAKEIVKKDYIPSREAIDMFDQNISIKRVIEKLYV